MQISFYLLLFFVRTDILLWIVGALSVVLAAALLFWHRREKKRLKRGLELLEGMNER